MHNRSSLLAFVLLTLVFIEGYIVLAYELIALRLVVPYAGSGANSSSIIIAAVLLPLALGYQSGGLFKNKTRTFRQKLLLNFSLALPFLVLGASYLFLDIFFKALITIGIHNPLMQISIYSTFFIMPPVYWLGQTVPLITNFYRKAHIPALTGRILLISTLGSLLGSLFTTLVLMSYIGVHRTAFIVAVLLIILVMAISKKKHILRLTYMGVIGLLCYGLNSTYFINKKRIHSFNQYNLVQTQDEADSHMRYFMLNGKAAGAYNTDTGDKLYYIQHIEDYYLKPLAKVTEHPLDILVLGGGGMTLGSDDTENYYSYVEIDPHLEDVTEKHLLKKPLTPNKKFIPLPIRQFLATNTQKYDLIVLDINDWENVPAHLMTEEFFLDVKKVLKNKGIFVAMFLSTAEPSSDFARNISATLARSLFPFNRYPAHTISNGLGYDFKDTFLDTVIHVYYKEHDIEVAPYNDLKNRAYFDSFKQIKSSN